MSLPAITGRGVEVSTVAGNEAAFALLCTFLEHFLRAARATRALATVDDRNADDALVEYVEGNGY